MMMHIDDARGRRGGLGHGLAGSQNHACANGAHHGEDVTPRGTFALGRIADGGVTARKSVKIMFHIMLL
jgi:hypothetical protein